MAIQTWQYAVRTRPDTENVESERHEQFMNELGAEGWELVCVIPVREHYRQMFFKKPSTLPAPPLNPNDVKKLREMGWDDLLGEDD